MVRWHHQLNGCEFEQTLGDGEGQGSLACCSAWRRKESDTTEQLNCHHQKMVESPETVSRGDSCLLLLETRGRRFPRASHYTFAHQPTRDPLLCVGCVSTSATTVAS